MAGHSKFKNIQHRKNAQDRKKAKIFTKLVREIISAAKIGGTNANNNPRLKNAIIDARAQNLPKERIDRALAAASDTDNNEHYTEIRYEGFIPSGIAIIVEVVTDNKNRSAAEIRSAFTKFGGHLGETGSVSFMFQHLGIIKYSLDVSSVDNMLEAAIEAGASDVVSDDNEHTIYTEIANFTECVDLLTSRYGAPEETYIGWKPNNIVLVEDLEAAEKLIKFIDLLEDNEDVERVFGNYGFSPNAALQDNSK
jgi:YebC/PmpR family DNA-binding regulatory protein